MNDRRRVVQKIATDRVRDPDRPANLWARR
jgi:hypothetical protein